MKRTFLFALILMGICLAFAQNIKLAYVNTDVLLRDSNEANEIARVYDLDRQNWANQIKSLLPKRLLRTRLMPRKPKQGR